MSHVPGRAPQAPDRRPFGPVLAVLAPARDLDDALRMLDDLARPVERRDGVPLREALHRDGGNAQYAYNLGLALVRQGRNEEAVALFRRSLTLRPGFRAARQRLAELGAS